MSNLLRVRIDEIALFQREVTLRLPFRFGVVTLMHCPQAFARVHLTPENGRSVEGVSAELMVPKWFDKTLGKSNDDNIADLAASLHRARTAYLSDRAARTAFEHFATHHRELIDSAVHEGSNALAACYGPAVIDRAVLDAVCRALDISFYKAIRGNVPGIRAGELAPDLAGFDLDAYLNSLTPSTSIAVNRH